MITMANSFLNEIKLLKIDAAFKVLLGRKSVKIKSVIFSAVSNIEGPTIKSLFVRRVNILTDHHDNN